MVGRGPVAFLILALAPVVAAQAPQVIGVTHGVGWQEALGFQHGLAAIGDINADTVPDFVAGAPNWAMPNPLVPGTTLASVGKVRVISGASMTQLFEIAGTAANQSVGAAVANVGDCDGDGIADFAIGAPMFAAPAAGVTQPPPQVQIWSGATWSLMRTITSGTGGNFGGSIAGIGDVGQAGSTGYSTQLDGVPDVLIGAPAASAAAVYSGADGLLLYVLDATTLNPPLPSPPLIVAGDHFGGTVAAAGDVTGDGVADLLISVAGNTMGGRGAGAVLLLSGAGGAVVHVFLGGPFDCLGQSVAGVGDVDGDLVPDIAIGTRSDVGGHDTGSVVVYSGANWAPLWTAPGLALGDLFGFAIANAGDLTGDGVADVIAGGLASDIGGASTGSAALLDGATGARLGTINGLSAGDNLGRSVAAYADIDGDGTSEVLVAAPFASIGGSTTGTVSVVSFGPYLHPCAAGTIPAPGGGTFDVIRINGSAGGAPRRVDLGSFQPFTLSFTQPPTFINQAPLYAFVVAGVPLLTDETPVTGIGLLCFPPPVLSPADPRLTLLSDSFFSPDPTALFPVSSPGSWSIPVPGGLLAPFRVAVSGIVSDGPLYVTNTVMLNVK